ncbi:hypothetical protein GCM10010967_04980 [Dyadobacter beijingensis]|uniref:DUF4199 domain-containing protein n=1 Tax=Dyadobacter beijingensis TaxID=365489 RepID=A0ABQ2HEB8_9BACT|nr:DUF4199 domain-containing protein [Dyadobacter beijingensis]GGM76366.1 hypothetical protein GCM10010967_04980 [Dyadobacter beijingensis]
MNSILAYFNKPILKVSLQFGAATGIAAFLFFTGLYLVGAQPLAGVRVLDMGIYTIMIFSGLRYFRKNYGNGLLHLWEALTMGYVITCVGAIINGWLIYLFVTYIDPAVFSDYITNALDVLTQGRKSQTSYLSDKEFLELYETVKNNKPSILISNEITQRLVMAIIPILVISLILRKQDYSVLQNNKT